jgi:hypothetical protein
MKYECTVESREREAEIKSCTADEDKRMPGSGKRKTDDDEGENLTKETNDTEGRVGRVDDESNRITGLLSIHHPVFSLISSPFLREYVSG